MDEKFMERKTHITVDIINVTSYMVLSMLVNSFVYIVDSFVAQINENAMTALSLVYPVQNFITAVAIGFAIGINSIIAFI